MPSTRGSPIAEQSSRKQGGPPSSVTEDYLKAIYAHAEWEPENLIGSSQLAQRLGLAPSSVTEMVKKLVAQGLVEHAPYGAIGLTASGRSEALRMVRRHRLVETWLVQQFGYGWDEVHDEAEILEHTLSDRLLDAIDAQLGRPTLDPHGDPIPAADLTMPEFQGIGPRSSPTEQRDGWSASTTTIPPCCAPWRPRASGSARRSAAGNSMTRPPRRCGSRRSGRFFG